MLHDIVEVRADAVHLVDERDARDVVASAWRQTVSDCGSTPPDRAEHGDRAVQHAQRALDLDREVDVAGRVDDVDRDTPVACSQRQVVAADVIVMPRSCSCSIQSMVAAPSCTSPILWMRPGVVKDALGGRGLARIDVRHDADITEFREWCGSGHRSRSLLCFSVF